MLTWFYILSQCREKRAASDVVEALAWFEKNPCADVLVVARGGGSPEDLAAFNSEGVARAIAASAIPVVSAVGHETDFTIADFVADLRAPTPSVAAEMITDAQYRVEEYLELLAARLERAVGYQRMHARERFAQLNASAVFAGVQHGLARRQQRVDELRFRLEASWHKNFASAARRIDIAQANLMRQDVRRQMKPSRGATAFTRSRAGSRAGMPTLSAAALDRAALPTGCMRCRRWLCLIAGTRWCMTTVAH